LRAGGLRLKEVEVAQAIAEADALISLAHVKGHPRTGLGGTLKNIGVGCVTKCGRAPLHLARKPHINWEKCDDCGKCIIFCSVRAISKSGSKPLGVRLLESMPQKRHCGLVRNAPRNEQGALHKARRRSLSRNKPHRERYGDFL